MTKNDDNDDDDYDRPIDLTMMMVLNVVNNDNLLVNHTGLPVSDALNF